MTSDNVGRGSTSFAVYALLTSEQEGRPPDWALPCALSSVSIETFMSREIIALKDPTLVGVPLATELDAIDLFSGSPRCFSKVFVDDKFDIHVVDALIREIYDLERRLQDDSLLFVLRKGGKWIGFVSSELTFYTLTPCRLQ